ncbi:MAG: hypothetical protein ACK2UI_05970, partial [Anaerolineae bacterium]
VGFREKWRRSCLIIYVAYHHIGLLAQRSKSPLHDWLKLFTAVSVLLVVKAMGLYIAHGLNLTSSVQAIVTLVVATILYVLTAWVVLLS